MKKRIYPSAAAAIAAFVLTSLPVHARQVRVEASVAQPVMLAGEKATSYLKVGLTGFEFAEAGDERPPVNVAIVLDKSGSMGGEKMARAKEAAKMAIERLGKDDIVSVVTYDANVHVVVPATKVSDKAEIFRMVDAIEPGGSTALFGGVAKGAAELRKFRDRERVNRVILVSDGLANVGPDTPGALGELGVSLRKEGISVSTVGLGSGYNEDLMFALAEKSDGNHAFAESGKELAAILDSEFGDVLSVAAQEVLVKIDCSPGVRPVRVLGRDAEISGGTATVLLNQLYSEQEKYVLLEVEVPAGEAGGSRDLASVEVSYANMSTQVTDEISTKVAVRFSASAAEVAASTDKDTMVASVMQVANYNNKRAMKLRDEGKITEAQEVLVGNGLWCLDNAGILGSQALRDFGALNRIDAGRLEGNAWHATRKAMRADQFKNDQQISSRGYNSRHNEVYGAMRVDEVQALEDKLKAAQKQTDVIDTIQLGPTGEK